MEDPGFEPEPAAERTARNSATLWSAAGGRGVREGEGGTAGASSGESYSLRQGV
jgi:hypothetical protein